VVVKDGAEAHPEDYHDYVFAKGKLVGKFDEMYRFAKGVPWDQDKRCNDWYAEVGLLMLSDKAPYASILEMGCGLGYITAKLKQRMSQPGGVIHGFDVSPEAVRKASEAHEGIEFWVDDLRRGDFAPRRQYDLVVVRDVFWYVFDSMPVVMANIAKSVRPGGTLYVGQSFPALDRPFVGKEVIPDPDALLRYFEPRFDLIHSMRLRRHRVETDGPILHFLAERKG
jgi:SAM-dependent methyltransferase